MPAMPPMPGMPGMPGGPFGGNTTGSAIAGWVEAHYTPTTIEGVTLYDLSAPPTS